MSSAAHMCAQYTCINLYRYIIAYTSQENINSISKVESVAVNIHGSVSFKNFPATVRKCIKCHIEVAFQYFWLQDRKRSNVNVTS